MEVKLFSRQSEKLYIANSDGLIKLIMKSNLEQVLDQDCYRMCHEEDKKTVKVQKKDSTQNYFLSLFKVSKNDK